MNPVFPVRPLGGAARFADKLAYPLMQYFAAPGDSSQLTHFWNNTRVQRTAVDHLNTDLMVELPGDPSAPARNYRVDTRFHRGAWKTYVVLQPKTYRGKWYVGWKMASGAGVSRIPVANCVRLLVGPDNVQYFGVRLGTCEQIALKLVDIGKLGDERHTSVPLQ
jgi:hypothetical protein